MAGLALSMTFVVTDRVLDPVPAGFTPWQVIWTTDQDPQAAQAVIARNARVGAALAARFGQVAETPRGQLDPEELMLVSDGALPPEAMIHRLARRNAWTFHPEGPVSEMSLCLFDGMATVDLKIADASPARRAEIAALVDRIAEVLQQEAAMSLWDYQRSGVVADAPGEHAVLHASGMLDRQARTERNAALRHRAGPVVAVLLTLAFVVGTLATLRLGLDSGGVAETARTSPVETFVTLEVPQTGLRRLLPDYALIGTVKGESIRLSVGRPEYIRAAVGARFSVISTGDPGRPYVLLSQIGSTAPTVPVFGGRTLPLHSLLIVAGLSALWVVTVLRPLLSRPPRFDRITRSGIALAKAGGALVAAVLAGLILRRYF